MQPRHRRRRRGLTTRIREKKNECVVLEARVLRDDIWWPSGIEVLCETLMGSRRGRARNGGTTSPLLAALEPFTFKVNKMCLFAVHYLGTLCSADVQRQCFSSQPAVLFSHSKSAPTTSHNQRNKVISALAPVIRSLMLTSALF